MADSYKEFVDWASGVITSIDGDQIPENAFSKGINTSFVKSGLGRTSIGTRPGLNTVNTTALTSSPAIHWQAPYSYNTGSAYTNYVALCTADGKLYYRQSNDTLTAAFAPPSNFPAPASLCFSAGTSPVDGTVLDNRLFLVNDASERRSLVNQTYVPWGLSPIASWVTAENTAITGGNSMPAETYDVTVTSYNSTSGGESSSSTLKTVTLGGANRRISVTISPSSAETAQYTHWRIFIRRQTTQSKLYKVLTFENVAGADIVTDGNIPIATTAAYLDLSAATIATQITAAPSTSENDPPASSITHVTAFGRRLICADGRNIYWSKQDQADNFGTNNFEPIETGEGDQIIGLHQYSDELLMIFLTTGTWGLYGNDPQTWALKPIDLTIGCASRNSIVSMPGNIAWWDRAVGPVIYDGTDINRVGQMLLGLAAVTTELNSTRSAFIYAGHDPAADRIVWSVSSLGSSINDRLLVFNYALRRFEASYWSTIDAASFATAVNTGSETSLYLGGYYGQLFYFSTTYKNDGVPSGTLTGEFIPATTSITEIAGTGFYTTGSGLANRYVVIVDGDYLPVDRVRITSNTASALTLATAVTPLVLSTTYTYYIGSPDFRFYGRWMDFDQPFLRKRFDRLYYHFGAPSGIADAYVSTQLEFDEDVSTPVTNSVLGESLWDTADWDAATWTGSASLKQRLSVGRSGTALRPVIFVYTPGRELIVQKLAIMARMLGDRYYA